MKSLPRDGSAWIIGLLGASLLLVAALAWQALDATLSHRTAAEAVLRDYARLAVDEFIRRASAGVGYYGYYQVSNAVAAHYKEHPGTVPSHQALLAADPRNERALTLVRYFFQLDTLSRQLDLSRPAPDAAALQWLESEIQPPSPQDDPRPFAVANVDIGGKPRSFAHAGLPETSLIVGFEVELASLKPWFDEVLARGPLLPPSVGKGLDESDYLALTVHDGSYRHIYSSGQAPTIETAYPLSASAPFGDAYEGVFDGLSVRVTLSPAAASELVIGGLPRSRLPMLLGLMIVTVGLLLAAIFQLRSARSLAQLRADFVSEVSHELRTPLTQIRMFAETLLLGRVRSQEETQRSLEIVDQEARRLSHLVENILQFSRGERGTMRLAPKPHDLVPLVRDLVRGFAPLVGRRDVSFAFHPAEEITALVDADALRQVLLNLLDNAVKYGPTKQQIIIGLEASDDGWARISVDDEGPGVPAPDRQRIWRSFQRLERDRRSAIAGTGIGLAVVRDLVALQGGGIRVEQGARGGARFVIELPLAENQRVRESGMIQEVSA